MKYFVFIILEVDSEVDFSETIAERFYSEMDGRSIVNEKGRSVLKIESIKVMNLEDARNS